MIISTLDSLKTELMTSLAKYDSVGIVTHQNPDGDGLPACIALKILLENSGYHSTIVLEEPAPKRLPLSKRMIIRALFPMTCNLMFCFLWIVMSKSA